jgi:hypothetical protein
VLGEMGHDCCVGFEVLRASGTSDDVYTSVVLILIQF